MTTAKQRAWRKKFAAMYGGGRKKKRSTRKRRTSPARARSRTVTTMARRRYYGRRRRSSRRGGFGSVKSLAGKAALGIGAGALLGMVAPSMASNPLVRHGAAFVLGGPVAALGSVVASGGLGNILGGGSSGNMNW